jgi:hypothetical protein
VIVRVLGVILVVVGIASILTIALPNIIDISFRSTVSTKVVWIGVNNDGIYLTAYACHSLPAKSVYDVYLQADMGPVYYGRGRLRIRDPSNVKVYLYVVEYPGCAAPVMPSLSNVDSINDIEVAIKSYTAYQPYTIYSYRGLKLGDRVYVNTNSRNVVVITVVYLPTDSFMVETSTGVVSGRTVVSDLMNNINAPWASNYYTVLQEVMVRITQGLAPRITVLAIARATSVIAAGLLVVSIDAGLHPEYYSGGWAVFRRVAEKLGVKKRR